MLNEQTATLPPDAPTSDQLATTAEPTGSTSHFDQLRMLSQAPLSLEQALQKEAAVDEDIAEAPATVYGLLSRFAGQLALFIGVGLVAAAVVHHSADPTLYKLLALGGGLLFAGGSILSAPKTTQGGIVPTIIYGITSLALGLGAGLLVGGILHFSAAPHQSTVTIPLGLAVAIGAFFARDGRQFIGKGIVPTAVTLGGLLVWLSLGLAFGAKEIDPPATPRTPAAEQSAPATGDHGATPAGEHGEAAAGEHGAAAAGEDDPAASADHGAETTEAAAAEGEHGAAAAEGEHGATAADAEHGATKSATDHGTAATTADHGATTADHGAAKTTAEHGATAATADHGTAKAASPEAAKPKYAEPSGDTEHDAAATGHATVSKYASPDDAAAGH